MFNSLGNLAVDDTAALLFVDFESGDALHLSGRAVVEWTTPGTPCDDGRTGRRVLGPTTLRQQARQVAHLVTRPPAAEDFPGYPVTAEDIARPRER